MRITTRLALVVALALTVIFTVGAEGTPVARPAASSPSTPTIIKVTPDPASPSGRPQAIVVEGREFLSGLTLLVRTPEGGTADVKGKAIQDLRPASFQVSLLLDTPGTYALTVVNTDGGTSDPYLLKVQAAPAPDRPIIERVTPAQTIRSDAAQDVQVDGRRFDGAMRVYVTDPTGEPVTDLRVGPVSERTFVMQVRLDKTGDYQIVVVNPNKVASNTATIAVK